LLTIFEKRIRDWTKIWNNISQQAVLTMIS
jgi:hypothetical protein